MSEYHEEGCNLYLARPTRGMGVEFVDGCHSDPKSVAKAAKLYKRIFKDEGPWLMVEIHEFPADLDPPINEEAASGCRQILAGPPLPTDQPQPRTQESEEAK